MKQLLFVLLLIFLETVLLAVEGEEKSKIILYPYSSPKSQSEIDQKKKDLENRDKYKDFERRIRNVCRKVEYESLLPEGKTKIPNTSYTLPKDDIIHKRKTSKEHQILCKQLLNIFREMEDFYKDWDNRQEILSDTAMAIYYYMNPNYKSDRVVIEYAMPYLEWRIWKMPLRITNWDSPIQYIWILSENAQRYPQHYKKFLKNRKKYLERYLEIMEQCRTKLYLIPELEEKIRTFEGNRNVMEDKSAKSRLNNRLKLLNDMKEDVHQRSLLFGVVVVLLYDQTSYSEKDMKEIQDLMTQYHVLEEYQEKVFEKVEKAKNQKQTTDI